MLKLEDVTLLAVSTIEIPKTIYALMHSSKNIAFKAVKLISDKKPLNLPSIISWESCTAIKNIDDYNKYILYELYRHVDTKFVLLIQYDGYVLRPQLWDNKFLEWDYVGAPWPIKKDAYVDPDGKHVRVGNGGFSLRSKKLLMVPTIRSVPFDVASNIKYKNFGTSFLSEDGNICVHNHKIFEDEGCKFAPIEIAVHFSQETWVPEIKNIKAFGFHKYKRPLRLKETGPVKKMLKKLLVRLGKKF